MTDNNHPITPPPELVQQWWDGTHGAFYEFQAVATQAARWGADMELEACCEWLHWQNLATHQDLIPSLRADRRPKPPSLKELNLKHLEVNLKHLEVMERNGHYLPEIIADLRRVLEFLSN